jgi:hypothetical protein
MFLPTSVLLGQTNPSPRAIAFPDIPGYLTLKVDLHMHTVFSDGSVWPDIRVQEAIRDGLDAIAVTDHVEYQPHKDDIPHPDRNRSHEIATQTGRDRDSTLIVIRGSEITRSMPPGHANAIFLSDVNPIIQDDATDAYREAAKQGAFTFWNHPAWVGQRGDGIATLTDLHRQLISDGLLHGIEVVNMHDYSEEALQIALDHDLTIIGTSDIHGLIEWEFEHGHQGHRPVTLVFATERSEAGIREALVEGRTAVWFRNILIGKEEWLSPLVRASLEVVSASYDRDRSVLRVEIDNKSDVDFIVKNVGEFNLHTAADVVSLPAHQRSALHVKTREQLASTKLVFDILNTVVAPSTSLTATFDVTVE